MEEIKTITISCQGSDLVNLDDLVELQGTLKELTEKDYKKLKDSILTYGFSFPAQIWIDPEGNKWIIDGHQRYRVLSRMRDVEGYTIPLLPASKIYAESRKQAKKKLLVGLSRYAKVTREGFDDFLDEVGFEIEESEMQDLIDIPEIQLWDQNETITTPVATDSGGNPTKTREIACPSCGHKFSLFDSKDEVV